MTNLSEMMKQAQELQARMAEMQEKLAEIEITGSAGGGMVQVTLDGKGGARRIRIDPSLVQPDDAAVLEDLILAAFNDAKGKLEDAVREKMSELTGGLPLPPGMQLPF
ncbi:MAG: YbaB/EbfC family nucleoid-associated protein [Rhodospirillales bacterium]